MDLDELMRDAARPRRAGREPGSLRSSEMSDPTITVTNLGDQGVEAVFGVIYPPQVALVGFGAIVERPWAVGGMVGARPVVTATLAADHRASDGIRGARFLAAIDRLLQEPGGAMNDTEVRAASSTRSIRRVAPEVDLAGLPPDADFREELDLDSMDFLNLVDALHERTGVDIPERDYPQLASIDGCVAYVTARWSSSPASQSGG